MRLQSGCPTSDTGGVKNDAHEAQHMGLHDAIRNAMRYSSRVPTEHGIYHVEGSNNAFFSLKNEAKEPLISHLAAKR